MSTDSGIWGWTGDIGHLGFTVSFSLGRSPQDVLYRYGVDGSAARPLSRTDAWASSPPNYRGGQLRAGTVGRWGFCFEEAGIEGFKPATLTLLSEDTETLSFYTAAGASSFIHLKDGQGVEAFEPGLPFTLRGEEPTRFWNDTQKILERSTLEAPIRPAHAVLQVITKYVRGLLDRATLEGPLLTAYLPEARRPAPTTVPPAEPAAADPTSADFARADSVPADSVSASSPSPSTPVAPAATPPNRPSPPAGPAPAANTAPLPLVRNGFTPSQPSRQPARAS